VVHFDRESQEAQQIELRQSSGAGRDSGESRSGGDQAGAGMATAKCHARATKKQAMARKLRTSRSQRDRLLDPRNISVRLDTIMRGAQALGKRRIIPVADVKKERARDAQ
jgi:hypothetical protein